MWTKKERRNAGKVYKKESGGKEEKECWEKRIERKREEKEKEESGEKEKKVGKKKRTKVTWAIKKRRSV